MNNWQNMISNYMITSLMIQPSPLTVLEFTLPKTIFANDDFRLVTNVIVPKLQLDLKGLFLFRSTLLSHRQTASWEELFNYYDLQEVLCAPVVFTIEFVPTLQCVVCIHCSSNEKRFVPSIRIIFLEKKVRSIVYNVVGLHGDLFFVPGTLLLICTRFSRRERFCWL